MLHISRHNILFKSIWRSCFRKIDENQTTIFFWTHLSFPVLMHLSGWWNRQMFLARKLLLLFWKLWSNEQMECFSVRLVTHSFSFGVFRFISEFYLDFISFWIRSPMPLTFFLGWPHYHMPFSYILVSCIYNTYTSRTRFKVSCPCSSACVANQICEYHIISFYSIVFLLLSILLISLIRSITLSVKD